MYLYVCMLCSFSSRVVRNNNSLFKQLSMIVGLFLTTSNLACAEKSKLKLCSRVLIFTKSWTKSWYKLLDFVQTFPSLAGQ